MVRNLGHYQLGPSLAFDGGERDKDYHPSCCLQCEVILETMAHVHEVFLVWAALMFHEDLGTGKSIS